MEETTTNTLIEGRPKYQSATGYTVGMTIGSVILFIIFGVIQAEARWPRVVLSKE